MKSFVIATFLCLVLPLACMAESLVVPPGFENEEGPRSIGGAAPSEFRFQWRYPKDWFPNERITFTEFSFRRNVQTRDEIVTFSDVLIRFSTRQEQGLDPTFRNNLGDDAQQVYLGDVQQPLPVDDSPRPFDIVVPLTDPFEYNSASGDLLVDFAVRGGVDIPPLWDGSNASSGAVEYFSWSADEDAVGSNVTGRIPINRFVYYYSSTEDGDFNSDGLLDAVDIDLLSAVIGKGTNEKPFDVTGDDRVDELDRQAWVQDAKFANTFFGDANLDGEVNFPDFLTLSASFGSQGGWGSGDFDGNGEVQFPDFLLLSQNFGLTSVVRATAVPEPECSFLVAWAVVCLCMTRTRSAKPRNSKRCHREIRRRFRRNHCFA